MDFNCAKKLIFTFSSESIICNSSVQTPSPILLRTDCEVAYVGQVCKFSFFFPLQNEILVFVNLLKLKNTWFIIRKFFEKQTHKRRKKKTHTNCQNIDQIVKIWFKRHGIHESVGDIFFFYTFWNDSSPLWVLKRHFMIFFMT